MSNQTNSETRQWGSRFGYLMVAAGAAIGLGNIWRFPYLAYQGGGGIFLIVYIIVVALMGHPMVEMETAIGPIPARTLSPPLRASVKNGAQQAGSPTSVR